MAASPATSERVRRFGVFEVDLATRELRKQGRRIRLQSQPFQLLAMLLERAGELVTRDELRRALWPESVHVDFENGLNNAILRLRDALGDRADAPQFIETIPRLGYRFIHPIPTQLPVEPTGAGVGALDPPAGPLHPEAQPAARRIRTRWLAFAAALAALLLIAGALRIALMDSPPAQDEAATTAAPVPSIAVLPFESLSSDPDNEHFAAGLTEELVSKLAGIRGLRVVARTSSDRFRRNREPPVAIAQALHVDHFIEGSVRRSGGRLRITAQLIDARRDAHLWSQSFERGVSDVFQIQEEIALAVAGALKVSLLEADEARVRRRSTRDVEAHRLYWIAYAHLTGNLRSPDFALAKRLLDRSIARDPSFAAAHAGLALYYFQRGWTELAEVEESLRLGSEAADRAVALDPDASDAVLARGNFLLMRHRFRGDYGAYVAAQRELQRAIELDPANPVAFFELCRALAWTEPDRALELCNRVIELDPLKIGPQSMVLALLGIRGQPAAARKLCAEIWERTRDRCKRDPIAALDTYYGDLAAALGATASEESLALPARIRNWSVHASMGNRAEAERSLPFGSGRLEQALSDAARHALDQRHDRAFEALDRSRAQFSVSRLLDLPAAKFALLAGRGADARRILEQRVPDLATGVEPITARNLLPALDLATAYLATGARGEANSLLGRIRAFLDGTTVRLPMIAFQRARAEALAGEADAALRSLGSAYDEGFRTTWAVDLRPQPLLYLDPIAADPAFSSLQRDPRFRAWLARIEADNARQLARLNAQGTAASGVDRR